MDVLNLEKIGTTPIQINNQILVLGSPIIPVTTIQQLTKALDNIGAETPIVIINPEANSVPNFDQLLSNLIQNNRSRAVMNTTTTDKYYLKDFTDDQLRALVNAEIDKNPNIEFFSLFDIYQGLRARSQGLYAVEMYHKERDYLWAQHLSNPQSTEGYSRYSDLVNRLIPESENYYRWVCGRLSQLQVKYLDQPQVTSPVVAEEPLLEESEPELVASQECSTSSVKLWGPWNSILNMQMPIEAAKSLVNTRYAGIASQQRDVVVNNVQYKAVEPEILIALGVDLIPDGVPIVYTDIGTFKRVGDSNHSASDVNYWYPKPKVKELI